MSIPVHRAKVWFEPPTLKTIHRAAHLYINGADITNGSFIHVIAIYYTQEMTVMLILHFHHHEESAKNHFHHHEEPLRTNI